MKVGLAGTDEPKKEPPFYTLTTLMKKHNHEYIDILKVDVEGAEFESMTRFMDDHAEGDLPVGLISMELHLDDPAVWTFGKVTNFMERLESFGMRITAYELNLGAAALYGTIKYNEVDLLSLLLPSTQPGRRQFMLTEISVRLGKHKR